MNEVRWSNDRMTAPIGRIVRVMYADGIECNAARTSGRIFYPQGSSTYRYVDVVKWRELTEDEMREAAAAAIAQCRPLP